MRVDLVAKDELLRNGVSLVLDNSPSRIICFIQPMLEVWGKWREGKSRARTPNPNHREQVLEVFFGMRKVESNPKQRY